MIETGLIYVYATRPARRFVGCGALVERGFIATCRHVWTTATKGWLDDKPTVEIEYPHAGVTSTATLADACQATDGRHPDFVLLKPDVIPTERAFQLQMATQDSFETSEGFSMAGIRGRDPDNPDAVEDAEVQGTISDRKDHKRVPTVHRRKGAGVLVHIRIKRLACVPETGNAARRDHQLVRAGL
jgi:hypothetical protein